MACPGSVALCAQLPKPKSGPAAAEGTGAHGLAEGLMKGTITKAQLLAKEGEAIRVEDYDIEITEEMIDAVFLYHDTIKAIEKGLRGNGRGAVVVAEYEKKEVATSIDDHVYGTCDARIYQKGNALHVIDFKYGAGVIVEPKENEQMMIYGISALDALKTEAFDKVVLTIIQPRGRGHEDGVVRSWETTVKQLRAFGAKVKLAAAETRKSDAKFDSGPWCRWCAAKADCPVMYKAVQVQAQADFSGMSSPKTLESLPPVATLPLEKMAAVLDWEEAITAYFKAIKERAESILNGGGQFPGFKLVQGRQGDRKWANEEAVAAEFGGLLDVYAPRKLLTPAQLEKTVGKGKVDKFTTRADGRVMLARDTDPRPSVVSSASTDFTAVEAVTVTDESLDGLV
jgi:hypothetical protein